MAQIIEDTPTAKLSKEKEAQLVERLHDRSIEHRIQSIKELDARFYPTAGPKHLAKETIQGSVTRQVDQEMARRKADHVELVNRFNPEVPRRTIDEAELMSSVERLYTESIAHKKKSMEESRQRYLQRGPVMARKKPSEIKEYVEHLAVPKKREFTVDEINKIYGLT